MFTEPKSPTRANSRSQQMFQVREGPPSSGDPSSQEPAPARPSFSSTNGECPRKKNGSPVPWRKIHMNVLKKKKKSGLPASSWFPCFCIVTAGTDGGWARLRTSRAWPRKAWCSPGMLASGRIRSPHQLTGGFPILGDTVPYQAGRLVLSGPPIFFLFRLVPNRHPVTTRSSQQQRVAARRWPDSCPGCGPAPRPLEDASGGRRWPGVAAWEEG